MDAIRRPAGGRTVVLYFPPSSFSPRFSNESLIPMTTELTGWAWSDGVESCSPRYVVYHVHVRYGREQWLLKRRYSHFLTFHKELLNEFPSLAADGQHVAFPPKSWACFGMVLDDESFLSSRQDQLCDFLVSLLGTLNSRGLLQCVLATDFLELRSKATSS